jgi:hypothetical protein
VQIPELDFEIPPEAQRGSLSTVSSLKSGLLFHFSLYWVLSGSYGLKSDNST